MTWQDAFITCTGKNGTLAVVDSSDVFEFLQANSFIT